MPDGFDKDRNGGGVMINVREDTPSKIFEKHWLPNDIKGIFIELTFRKIKCLLSGSYHYLSQNYQY